MLNNLKNKKVSSSIIAIIILVLILLCVFVLFFEINNYRDIKSEQHNFYYYFTNDRLDFSGEITLDTNNTILSLNAENVAIDNTPVYFKDNDKQMILPENMEIVYPYKNDPMYKVGKFSKIYYLNSYIYINSEAGIGRLYDCFLYDGNDLYVFTENTTVIIDEEKYELSPMSFVEVTKGYISIYNKEKKDYKYIEKYKSAEAYTEEYLINLIDDSFTYNNLYYMLMKNVDKLDLYEF